MLIRRVTGGNWKSFWNKIMPRSVSKAFFMQGPICVLTSNDGKDYIGYVAWTKLQGMDEFSYLYTMPNATDLGADFWSQGDKNHLLYGFKTPINKTTASKAIQRTYEIWKKLQDHSKEARR